MEIKILGVSGSPIEGGNTETYLREALRAASEGNGVQTELVTLAGKEIRGCRHCGWCFSKQEQGKFCAQNDDMGEMFLRLLEADGLLLATPVYMGRLSGYMATFLDRLMVFMRGNFYRDALKNKVGGALAVSWMRNAGGELALINIVCALISFKMIAVSSGVGFSHWGGIGLSSEEGLGRLDPEDKLLVLKDEHGLRQAHILGKRVVEVARVMKAGQEALRIS